jgi:hypothetical protein
MRKRFAAWLCAPLQKQIDDLTRRVNDHAEALVELNPGRRTLEIELEALNSKWILEHASEFTAAVREAVRNGEPLN